MAYRIRLRRWFRKRWLKACVLLFTVMLLISFVREPPNWEFISDVNIPCIIPKLDPWDPSIIQFQWEVQPLNCDATPAVIYLDDTSTLQYNSTALLKIGVTKFNLRCHYSIMNRLPNDNDVEFESAVPFSPPFNVDSDFFRVTCATKVGHQLFDELFASIRPKHNFQAESKEELSVLLFAIDSVSRSQSIRRLSKTVKYLKEELGSYDFEGFMNVGGGTFQNCVPLLTGRKGWSDELPVLDWANEPFDPFPFIWKNFSRQGYTTMFAEDFTRAGTFKYDMKGFDKQPTDHYMFGFWKGVDKLLGFSTILNVVFEYIEERNIRVKPSSTLCYGTKPRHVIQSDYVKQFFRNYEGIKKFAFSLIGELTHDFNNFVALSDDDFLDFLKVMKAEGHLDNTLLVFFSDHGTRVDKIRTTDVGRIEFRMPMLHIVVPDHIKLKYPNIPRSMELNRERLSTTYDLHQTLADVLSKNFQSPTKLYVKGALRGISLFQPLPEDRTCAEAAIREDVCSCYASKPVSITKDPSVTTVAGYMLKEINAMLSHEPLCSQVELSEIVQAELIARPVLDVRREDAGSSIFNFLKPVLEKPRRYLVSIETLPGHARFEVTADVDPVTGAVSPLGEIARANRYGNQPSCIKDRSLHPYCFCKDKIGQEILEP